MNLGPRLRQSGAHAAQDSVFFSCQASWPRRMQRGRKYARCRLHAAVHQGAARACCRACGGGQVTGACSTGRLLIPIRGQRAWPPHTREKKKKKRRRKDRSETLTTTLPRRSAPKRYRCHLRSNRPTPRRRPPFQPRFGSCWHERETFPPQTAQEPSMSRQEEGGR